MGKQKQNKNKTKQNKTKQKTFHSLYQLAGMFLKESSLIVQLFLSKLFCEFGITRILTFFLKPMANFTTEKCSIWKILEDIHKCMPGLILKP